MAMLRNFIQSFYGLFIENLLPSKFTEAFLTNTLLAQVANHVLIHLSGTKYKYIK